MITKFILALLGLYSAFHYSQVGINTKTPTTTLEIIGENVDTIVEGILIPKFTGDEIYNMPIPTTTALEGNLVYATSAASPANQFGKGANLKGKGFFFWTGSVWGKYDKYFGYQ